MLSFCFKAFAGEREEYFALKESFNDSFYGLTLNGCSAFLAKYSQSDFKEDVSLIDKLFDQRLGMFVAALQIGYLP